MAAGNLEDLKILLVDDSFKSLNLIRNLLKDLGVTQVFTAKNGMEALDLMGIMDGPDGIDVMLCDWNMPRMTGLEVLKQVRSCDTSMPFLMITGVADRESVV